MNVKEMNIRDMLQQLTKGRPYMFVIMAYNENWDLYERLSKIMEREFNLACLRADDLKSSGYDLLAKIHFLISRAELIIAEISTTSQNVFYEIGFAVGVQKSPILLMKQGNSVPTDLKGLEVIEYKFDRDGIRTFEADIANHIRPRLSSELPLLRDMLEAPAVLPASIVTSPKYPGRHSRILGQVYDSRTFGNHLGILGLISAFGSMVGESNGIELISAQHSPPDLLKRPVNLYLIGSSKINPVTKGVIETLQKGNKTKWSFEPAPGYIINDEDWPCSLYRISGNSREQIKGKTEVKGDEKAEVWTEDYGLILRGPHPNFPDRLILIMAGAHSLGTGAACLAATRSPLIKKIRSFLPEGILENKQSSFWVLVKGKASQDGLLDMEGVSIEDAGEYS